MRNGRHIRHKARGVVVSGIAGLVLLGACTENPTVSAVTGPRVSNAVTVLGNGPPINTTQMFVIGDVEPHGIGATVNFWGAQWWKNNFMSGFVANGVASFKGYPTNADNFCGGVWSTRPGNSPPPPSTIPQRIAVIVTSTVNKEGPIISGDIVDILLVDQDGGYAGNPGHRGNGVVVGSACQPGGD